MNARRVTADNSSPPLPLAGMMPEPNNGKISLAFLQAARDFEHHVARPADDIPVLLQNEEAPMMCVHLVSARRARDRSRAGLAPPSGAPTGRGFPSAPCSRRRPRR